MDIFLGKCGSKIFGSVRMGDIFPIAGHFHPHIIQIRDLVRVFNFGWVFCSSVQMQFAFAKKKKQSNNI